MQNVDLCQYQRPSCPCHGRWLLSWQSDLMATTGAQPACKLRMLKLQGHNHGAMERSRY